MKRKIIIYSVILVIFAVFTGFGIVSLFTNTVYNNNEVAFKVNSKDAYFQAVGKYYYGDVDVPTQEYEAQYVEEDYYSGVDTTIQPWEIGDSVFVNDDENPENNIWVLKYEISITNCNVEKNLNIKLYDLAVHSGLYFTTEVYYNTGVADELMFSNVPNEDKNLDLYYKPEVNPNKASITSNQVIGIGKTLKVKIVLTLRQRTGTIEKMANNFYFGLETVEV